MGKRPRLKPTRLPKKLLQIRQQLGLSQNGLIRRMGFTDVLVQASISGYELGTREPPLPVLLEYAEVAGVWVDVLINDDLDLPDKLPCSPKHEGVKRKTVSRSKRC
jgi:transcriptional regulator with XRE-family HTH domain